MDFDRFVVNIAVIVAIIGGPHTVHFVLMERPENDIIIVICPLMPNVFIIVRYST